MKWLSWRGWRRDEELDEEIQSHMRMAVQDRIDRATKVEPMVALRRE